jgi:hypothetical protein
LTIKFTHEQQTNLRSENLKSENHLLSNLTDACTVKLALCVSFLSDITSLISDLKFET